MLSEGGIRVPFVVAWPGRIPGGQRYEQPVISPDVAATALAAAGVPRPAELDGVDLVPFLTGAATGAPHETLYWRWSSQAAVLEFPWKLIALGDRERLLFDITTPEGEAHTRNLIREHPDIAARLEARLAAWCAKLRPPGLPTTFDSHHEGLFVEHGILAPGTSTVQRAERPAADWIARNGAVVVTNGALTIVPTNTASARPFLTHSQLDMTGPLRLTLLARARQGGRGAVSWRTKQDREFAPANLVEFDWPAATAWTPVAVELPVRGSLVHLRVLWPRGGEGIEVRSIELRPAEGEARVWRFDQ